MKAAELLKISTKILKVMSDADLRAEDYKYVNLYDDYCQMRSNGCKTLFIYYELSERYGVSESTVKRIVRRFAKEVKV